MTGSITNPKPRFGLNDDGTLFDYVASTDIPATGVLEESGGSWDLARVARQIRNGESIETAYSIVGKGGSPRFRELELQVANLNDDVAHARKQRDEMADEKDRLAARVQHLEQESATLREQNQALSDAKQLLLIQRDNALKSADELRDRVQQLEQERTSETPQPDANAPVDKVEQATKDFFAEGTDAKDSPAADVEGAMAAQEAPPKA